jgi:hypothetical protein
MAEAHAKALKGKPRSPMSRRRFFVQVGFS